MKMKLAIISTLFLTAVMSAQPIYRITEISGSNCAVSGINDFTGVAGQCSAVATAWQNGSATTLGKLPNGSYSMAQSVNSQGVAVGNGDAGDGRPRAELYRNGAVTDIDPSAANAYAIRINEAGVIAGDYLKGFGTCNNWSASIWVEDPSKPGTFRRTDLQPYPGGERKVRCEYATGANQRIKVVRGVQNSVCD